LARLRTLLGHVFVASVAFASATLAQPSNLDVCGRQCQELFPATFLFCDGIPWSRVPGRAWWGPLLCIGPVRISIEAYPLPTGEQLLPLFVEVRADDQRARDCQSGPGRYLWHTYGGAADCGPDSTLVISPVLDLPAIVGIGNSYYLQLHGFYDTNASSPLVRCVRLDALPTAITASTWGGVKQLYRHN